MATTSEVDKLIERYEDKAEHAWEEWHLGGSMRHEGLYNKYEEVVETLNRGRSAGLLASRHTDLKQDVIKAKTMDGRLLMSTTSDDLLPCPFCGGKAHIRRKIRYRRNEVLRKATVYDSDPILGTVENEVDLLDWRFGFQVWCGRCKVKTPYKWGPWNGYTKAEVEELDREDFYRHAPGSDEEPARLAAIDVWNRRASDDHWRRAARSCVEAADRG